MIDSGFHVKRSFDTDLMLHARYKLQKRPDELTEKEVQSYKIDWEKKQAEAEELRQDFDDFLNWRFHQIEFFFAGAKILPNAVSLIEWSADRVHILAAEGIQYIPTVMSKEDYARTYFILLEQLVRKTAVSVMEGTKYDGDTEMTDGLCKLIVCILTDSCHPVLRKNLSDFYGIPAEHIAKAELDLGIPEILNTRLGELLLSMEM